MDLENWARSLAALPAALDEEALVSARRLAAIRPELGPPAFLLALRHCGRDPWPTLRGVTEIAAAPLLAPAERARLLAKGKTLFEHCLAAESIVCVTGFMEHEATKGASHRLFLREFVAWMVEQRLELPEVGLDPASRSATDRMIRIGIGILLGESLEQAERRADPD